MSLVENCHVSKMIGPNQYGNYTNPRHLDQFTWTQYKRENDPKAHVHKKKEEQERENYSKFIKVSQITSWTAKFTKFNLNYTLNCHKLSKLVWI